MENVSRVGEMFLGHQLPRYASDGMQTGPRDVPIGLPRVGASGVRLLSCRPSSGRYIIIRSGTWTVMWPTCLLAHLPALALALQPAVCVCVACHLSRRLDQDSLSTWRPNILHRRALYSLLSFPEWKQQLLQRNGIGNNDRRPQRDVDSSETDGRGLRQLARHHSPASIQLFLQSSHPPAPGLA